VVNTATFACDGATGPAGNAHLQVIAPTITIVEPPPHAFIETGGAPFTTVTVTVQTYVDLPDEGYWLLQRDGVQVSGPIFTYSTPLSLTLGTHVISATLYSAQDVRLGEDGVKVYVAEQWKHIFLPIIMQDAPSADWRGHLFLPIVIQE
jgi:hypothetical protein